MAHDAGHGHGDSHGSGGAGDKFLKGLGLVVVIIFAALGLIAAFGSWIPVRVETDAFRGLTAPPPDTYRTYHRPPPDNVPPGWTVRRN